MKYFKTRQGANRIQQFIDHLSRKVYEPFRKDENGFSEATPFNDTYYNREKKQLNKTWEVASDSAGILQSAIAHNQTLLEEERTVENAPIGQNIAAAGIGWQQFEFDAIVNVVSSNSITSVTDATVKVSAYLKTIAASTQGKKRYLFRGQSDISWELKPKLGRLLSDTIKADPSKKPESFNKVTPAELKDLENFISAWQAKDDHDELDALLASKFDNNHMGWWVLMQHFTNVTGEGTRMLDVTSNLLVALYFACVNWNDGRVNTSKDGVLYFFMEGQGCVVDDYSKQEILPTNKELFNAKDNIPVMIFNPPHNERSKAQGGSFIWWPKFWEQPEATVSYLKIPKEYKLAIASELLAFGVGPKEIVRGDEGLKSEINLREQIQTELN